MAAKRTRPPGPSPSIQPARHCAHPRSGRSESAATAAAAITAATIHLRRGDFFPMWLAVLVERVARVAQVLLHLAGGFAGGALGLGLHASHRPAGGFLDLCRHLAGAAP